MHNIQCWSKNARNFPFDLFLVIIMSPTLTMQPFLPRNKALLPRCFPPSLRVWGVVCTVLALTIFEI